MVAASKAHILVIEDEPEIQRLATMMLETAGLQISKAPDLPQAAFFLRDMPRPDLILLDVDLPDASSIQFLRLFRQVDAFDRIPVIVVASDAQSPLLSEALAQGADRYVTKAYLTSSLVRTVSEVLRSGRVQRA